MSQELGDAPHAAAGGIGLAGEDLPADARSSAVAAGPATTPSGQAAPAGSDPRRPTLPPAPSTVPRPVATRAREGASQPPPAVAGASVAVVVPPPAATPDIDPYDDPSEVTTTYDPFGDDEPTVDYDPRARGVYSSSPGTPAPGAAATGATQGSARLATPVPRPSPSTAARTPSGPPPVPSLASEPPAARTPSPPRPAQAGPPSSQKRRTSRRTVRIPNDATERGDVRSSPPPAYEGTPTDDLTPEPNVDEGMVIKPMPIMSIGSEPPNRLATPARAMPAVPVAEDEEETTGRDGQGISREAVEQGWTPLPPVIGESQNVGGDTHPTLPVMQAVTDAILAEAGLRPVGAIPAPPAPPPPVETAPLPNDLEAISESDPELELIEAEDDARAVAPPPPPASMRVPRAPPAAPSSPSISTPPAALPPPPPATASAAPALPVMAPAIEEGAAKKPKPWWEDLFGDDYIRTLDRLDARHVKREVDFIEESLGLETGAVILDLACGEGQQAVELAARGYSVVGFDLSLPMLARAADEAQDRGQKINFLHGDMREMQFDEMFDGIYCWSTSFGYFDDERNVGVLTRIRKALRKGGNFLLDVVNRDYVASRAPSLVWFEGEGCTCMDDMHVDFFTSRLRVKRTAMFDDGHSRELDYSIRLYTLHELGKMLHEAGFKVVEVTGHPTHPGVFFGAESPRMIILAERA